MVIKNGDIKLLVEDTDVAIDRATQAVGDMGGYIISSRVWYQPYGDGETVDEALRINTELANVEAQIEQIKGQMNYLQNRSAFSTITINLEPKLPELVATPTSTPMPTPTPVAWKPGETFNHAKKAVTYAYQGIIDFLIWILVVFVPIFAPPVLIVWGLWKFFTRKSKKQSQ